MTCWSSKTLNTPQSKIYNTFSYPTFWWWSCKNIIKNEELLGQKFKSYPDRSDLFFTLTNRRITGWLHNNRKYDYITLIFSLFKKLYFLLDNDFLFFCNIFAFNIIKSNWKIVSILHFRGIFLRTRRPQKGVKWSMIT